MTEQTFNCTDKRFRSVFRHAYIAWHS